MRLFTLTLAAASLGLGGVALAQPSLVVDPWKRAGEGDSWFAAGQSTERLPVEAVLKDPWAATNEVKVAPVAASAPRVEVYPIERATASTLPKTEVIVVDPWAPPVVASETPSLRGQEPQARTERPASTPWADRVVEIVDPWKRMPAWTSSDGIRLVVDPWAR